MPTVTASFADERRQYFFTGGTGRYLVLCTAGWSDGRPKLPAKSVVADFSHAGAVAAALTDALSADAPRRRRAPIKPSGPDGTPARETEPPETKALV